MTFPEALRLLLTHEGGRVDDPQDPGGRTNKGVTQRVYDAWREDRGEAPRDVWDIDAAEVEAIYRERYWSVVQAERLPDGVDYAVFDFAVNSGPARAVKELQRAAGMDEADVDGIMGPVTLRALRAANVHDLIDRYADRRLAFLRGLDGWARYKGGWRSRVADVRTRALDAAPDPVRAPTPSARSRPESPARRKAKTGAKGAGLVVGGIAVGDIVSGAGAIRGLMESFGGDLLAGAAAASLLGLATVGAIILVRRYA